MKFSVIIIALALFLSLSILSQVRINEKSVASEHFVHRVSQHQKAYSFSFERLTIPKRFLIHSISGVGNSKVSEEYLKPYKFLVQDGSGIVLNPNFLKTEVIYQNWYDSSWVNINKGTFKYDTNNNWVELLFQTWYGNEFRDYDMYTLKYDSNNNQIEMIRLVWSNNTWINADRQSLVYDARNNQVEFLMQVWDGTNWVNDKQHLNTYDSNNNKIEILKFYWNGNSWENDEKHLFSYDLNNNQTEFLGLSWGDTSWVNVDFFLFDYDGNNNLVAGIYQYWNGAEWINEWKDSLTYDYYERLVEEIGYTWDGTNWQDDEKYTYHYDNSNNLIEVLDQYWYESWQNNYKYIYMYDVNNNLIDERMQSWNDDAWLNIDRRLYFYTPVTAVNEDKVSLNSFGLAQNYPNPFNPSTKIVYTIPERCHVSVKIFNSLGSEIAELVNGEFEAGNYYVEFNFTKLSKGINFISGVYFYQIRADNFVETKKMLLLK